MRITKALNLFTYVYIHNGLWSWVSRTLVEKEKTYALIKGTFEHLRLLIIHTMTEMITKNTLLDIRSDQANRPRLQLLLMFHIPCQWPDHTYNSVPIFKWPCPVLHFMPKCLRAYRLVVLHAYSFLTPQHCLLPCLDVTTICPLKCMNTISLILLVSWLHVKPPTKRLEYIYDTQSIYIATLFTVDKPCYHRGRDKWGN